MKCEGEGDRGEGELRTHHKLEVWKESIDLVEKIYKLTESFPLEERYIIVSQIRKSAISVPSNIAEGAARASKKEFLYFLNIARGSLSELETQLIIAKRLNYLENETIFEDIDKVFALLGGLLRSVKTRT